MSDSSTTDSDGLQQTAEVLRGLSGGAALLDWFGGVPEFGDSEVVSLTLGRSATSALCILTTRRSADEGREWDSALVTFTLADMIDVNIEGFGRQNVIGGLKLRPVSIENRHGSLIGIGLADGDHEIELEPCAGAFGTIRATVSAISLVPVTD